MLSQPKKPAISWAASKEVWQQVKGGNPSPLLCAGEASPRVQHPDVESSVLERHRAVGEHPEEGHKNGPRDGTPPYEYRLRAGMCSLEKGRLWGDLRVAFQYLKETNSLEGSVIIGQGEIVSN